MPNFSGLWTSRQQMQARGASTWPAVPGAPTIGTATVASVTSASVTFTAPSDLGYPASITSYTVTSSPGGITNTGSSSPIVVSGLTTGTAYTFTVTATNATGTGAPSSASNSVTPDANYIESVFSTYLYTGNGSTQTITTSIDISTNGGLVWVKGRNETYYHRLASSPGPTLPNYLASNATDAASSGNGNISAFTTTGFTVNNNSGTGGTNSSGVNYASWTFRKQPKFFDVVTYTGDGLTGKVISHSLGSTPGCIIFKRTDSTSDWAVYHRSLNGGVGPEDYRVFLNTTAAQTGGPSYTVASVSSTSFTLGSNGAGGGSALTNVSGATYVAYIFAHDAGGFGLSGSDNVISCGSFTSTTAGATITLGYEPQFLMMKASSSTGDWIVVDNMRGFNVTTDQSLYANTADAESAYDWANPTSTGFIEKNNNNGVTYIYIAIRRGPMRTPTVGTSVFQPVAYTGTAATKNITGASFPPDLSINDARVVGSGWGAAWYDRLRGPNRFVRSPATSAENTSFTDELTTFNMDGVTLGASANGVTNNSGQGYVDWLFGRAPNFFDEVCYTGTGANTTFAHNLGVAPELMIAKQRGAAGTGWIVYHKDVGATKYLNLNTTAASATLTTVWNSTAPTSSVFSVGTNTSGNASGGTYVNYLFATCAGVSKVGSYTGTGATQTISCGFTSGARWVMIKRTDSTGDWYVWDTARGMVVGTDPSLLINSATAEVNSNDIYTTSVGFQVVSAAAGINASGGTYIFLAIA